MKKTGLILLVIITQTISAQPSMTVSTAGNYQNPFWMAANVLVDSNLPVYDMPHVWSPTFTSQPNTPQIGYFQANDTTFPVQSGIVMVAAQQSSDVIASSPGMGANITFTDSELDGILTQLNCSGFAIKDMVSIEFSFYAQSDSIKFNYCFGSHEYDGYTCSNFNDVFGFFLEGPYIDGVSAPTGGSIVKNIATIPGTTVPIAVNTINSGSPSGAFSASNCLSANPNFVAHSAYYNHSNGSVVTLDGYTDKFTAKAQVQCGGWYTIRLKLANVGDHALSSAVFIEEQSFKGPKLSTVQNNNVVHSYGDSILVEGCNINQIIFKRSHNLNQAMKIPISVDTILSSAEEGIDFSFLPDTLTLAPNVLADTLEFWVYDDNMAEVNEVLVIVQDYVYTECYNYPGQTFHYQIRDVDSLFTTDVVSACSSYTWIDGNTYTTSNNTATYTLTNQEGCDSVVKLDLSIDNLSGSFAVSSTYYNPPNYITAVATGGTEYFWSADKPIFIDNAKNDSIQIALLTDSTTLYIEAENGTSCLFQDSILLRDTSVFICDVYDTTYISVYDTTYITQIDTFYLTVTDTLIIDVSLIGINPPTFEYQVLVYPNPTSSYLYVDVPQNMISQSYSMEIKNSIGQSVFGIAMNQPQIQINFNSFGAAGSYTLSIKDSGGNVVDTRVIILQ